MHQVEKSKPTQAEEPITHKVYNPRETTKHTQNGEWDEQEEQAQQVGASAKKTQ